MITLTVKQIADPAGFARLVLHQRFMPQGKDLEVEFTIAECPKEGVRDDDGSVQHYAHIAYCTEYPEEGCCPLGDEVMPNPLPTTLNFDLVAHLHRQRDFSLRTFGPGERTDGVLDHIRKELIEIESAPRDVAEWVDVILLALDGAWRAGHEPEAIAQAIQAKQERNESRKWPDWRTAEPGKAIEHVRHE